MKMKKAVPVQYLFLLGSTGMIYNPCTVNSLESCLIFGKLNISPKGLTVVNVLITRTVTV